MKLNFYHLIIFSSLLPSLAFAAKIDILPFQKHTRIQIKCDRTVNPEIVRNQAGFSLSLEGLSLGELEAGVLRDPSSYGPNLKELSVTEKNSVAIIDGVWKFKEGPSGPAHPEMESFSFWDDKEQTWNLDFWPKAGATRAEVEARKKQTQRTASLDQSKKIVEDRIKNKNKIEELLKVQNDVASFCKSPLSEDIDIFLKFRPVSETFQFGKSLPQRFPDESFPYLIPEAGTPDREYLRVAHQLMSQEKYALAYKSLNLLLKEYPKTTISRAEIGFLKANIVFRLHLKDQENRDKTNPALALLKEIVQSYPNEAEGIQSARFLLQQSYKNQDWPQVLDQVLQLSAKVPRHVESVDYHAIAAEAFHKMKQFDRAQSEYEWIEENSKNLKHKAWAMLGIGNIALDRDFYDQALASYYAASKKYTDIVKGFSTFYLNKGEALLGLGQYEDAEKVFAEFQERFPGYSIGWRALLRLAEIAGRSGPQEENKKYRSLLKETLNRFPFSKGALIAKLRLLPCGDHGNFDAELATQILSDEAQKFDAKDEIKMTQYPEFRALSRVRTLISMSSTQEALDASIQERSALVKGSSTERVLAKIEGKLFRRSIVDLMNLGNIFNAINVYVQYAPIIEWETYEVVPQFLLKLSRESSAIGLGSIAEQMYKQYSKVESRFHDTIISPSEKAATQALILWSNRNKRTDEKIDDKTAKKSGEKNRAQIDQQLQLIEDGSEFSYLKEVLLVLNDMESGRFTIAEESVKKAFELTFAPTEKIRLKSVLLDLFLKNNQLRSALNVVDSLKNIQPVKDKKTGAHEDQWASKMGLGRSLSANELVETEIDLLYRLEEFKKVAALQDLAGEESKLSNKSLYQIADSLRKAKNSGSRVENILKKVAESQTDDAWKQIARQIINSKTAMEGKSL